MFEVNGEIVKTPPIEFPTKVTGRLFSAIIGGRPEKTTIGSGLTVSTISSVKSGHAPDPNAFNVKVTGRGVVVANSVPFKL